MCHRSAVGREERSRQPLMWWFTFKCGRSASHCWGHATARNGEPGEVGRKSKNKKRTLERENRGVAYKCKSDRRLTTNDIAFVHHIWSGIMPGHFENWVRSGSFVSLTYSFFLTSAAAAAPPPPALFQDCWLKCGGSIVCQLPGTLFEDKRRIFFLKQIETTN